jgi:hypothetical protein
VRRASGVRQPKLEVALTLQHRRDKASTNHIIVVLEATLWLTGMTPFRFISFSNNISLADDKSSGI